MTHRILFVCLGNICRSPTAEAVLRAKAAARGVAVEIDSAGTGDWHIGKPPYAPMQAAAAARGYDLSDLRARQVGKRDFDRFDRVIGMDAQNLADLRGVGQGAALSCLTDFLDGPEDEVPDPYFTRDFEGALDLIERAVDALLDDLAGR